MKLFKHIVGNTITHIQRIDDRLDYESYRPYGLVLTIENLKEKLLITATNQNNSSDIKMLTDEDIKNEYGLEFEEFYLNELKKEDDLDHLVNEKITGIRIAEFIQPEITGDTFVVKQGTCAGVELKTTNHKILFRNKYGGWYDFDDDVVELPDPERWKWNEF